MYMYMYVCMYVCVCIYIYIYMLVLCHISLGVFILSILVICFPILFPAFIYFVMNL